MSSFLKLQRCTSRFGGVLLAKLNAEKESWHCRILHGWAVYIRTRSERWCQLRTSCKTSKCVKRCRVFSTFIPTCLPNRISFIKPWNRIGGRTSLWRSRKRPGSSRAGAIPVKAPPPRVIHVRLAQRLRGRAWLARLPNIRAYPCCYNTPVFLSS